MVSIAGFRMGLEFERPECFEQSRRCAFTNDDQAQMVASYPKQISGYPNPLDSRLALRFLVVSV